MCVQSFMTTHMTNNNLLTITIILLIEQLEVQGSGGLHMCAKLVPLLYA